jgi:Carboxypeptidase regulatory-like domain/TonB-dependent Receptor Plug Domain
LHSLNTLGEGVTKGKEIEMITRIIRSALALLAFTTVALSQDFRATISGLVTDQNGQAVASAIVKAIRIDTNETKEVKTTSEGRYTIPYLTPAIYNIEVTASGFQTLKRETITLRIADKLDLPLRLTVGAVSEAIVVTGQQEALEAGSADRGLVFDPIKTQELPLNGRQTYMLLALTPGVVFTQETFGPNGFSGTRGWDVNNSYKINGARTGQNLFLLNGAPISDNNGTWQIAPNVEAVQEFKVMTNTYDSSYGRFGGGVVNTTLKSGTNKWNGNVFDYFRNAVFDANYFQNNATGQSKPKHNQHQYGGVFGGPIRKDKDFLFTSFEGWIERIGFPTLQSVPPDLLRDGQHFNAFNIKIYDPLTTHRCGEKPGETDAFCTVNGTRRTFVRDPFPGNVIPANRLSPIGQKLLSYYPKASGGLEARLNNNFVNGGNVGRYKYYQPMARWDHIFSEKDKLNFTFTFQHGQEYRDSTGFGPPAGSGDVGSQRTDQNYIISWTHVVSPTTLLDVRASYGRFTSYFRRHDADDHGAFDRSEIRAQNSAGRFHWLVRLCWKRFVHLEHDQSVEYCSESDHDAGQTHSAFRRRSSLLCSREPKYGVWNRNFRLQLRLDTAVPRRPPKWTRWEHDSEPSAGHARRRRH